MQQRTYINVTVRQRSYFVLSKKCSRIEAHWKLPLLESWVFQRPYDGVYSKTPKSNQSCTFFNPKKPTVLKRLCFEAWYQDAFYLNDSYVIDTLLEHHLTWLTLLLLREIVHQFSGRTNCFEVNLSSLRWEWDFLHSRAK